MNLFFNRKKISLRKKHICIFLRLLVLFVFLIINFTEAGCQVQRRSNEQYFNHLQKTILNKSAFFFTLSTGVSQNAIINKKTGEYDIRSTLQPFFEGGINYQKSLKKNLFLIIGLRETVTGRNAIFKAPIKEINPYGYSESHSQLKINDFDFPISIPVFVEKGWQITKSKIVFIQTGVNFRCSLGSDIGYGYSLTDTNWQRIDVFSLELNSNNYRKPWINYNIGGGYGWVLKNYNILKLGVLANISFTKFISGTYQVDIPSHPLSQGTYGVTGSNMGLTVSYIFTGINKKLVKQYENN